MNNSNQKYIDFDGEKVYYSDETQPAMEHLRDHLDYEESKVFFEQARYHGKAEFEDRNEYNWTLKYNQHDGSFTLEKRN